MPFVQLAVLVSGSGTLLEAMIEASLDISLVVSDRPCRGLEVAATHGVDVACVERLDFSPSFDRDHYASRLCEVLTGRHIDVVAMAGFGTILGRPIFEAFENQIINTHPALLPAFPGWHGVRDALDYGVKVTGCTIHVATPTVDDGPILAQEAVSVLEEDTEHSLHERIKVVERRLYVETIEAIYDRGFVLKESKS